MIPNIRIKRDDGQVYEPDTVISADKLLRDFCEASNPAECPQGWLYRIPMPDAIDYMAKAWGIEYEYC